ncbi:MAG TPA: carboxypeptidase-like regulatory domain-containing protein [Actinoplanes sp.]|nr:carboxypeptidase-like regulatory domain-containing protein [Actinoplanes sp.]
MSGCEASGTFNGSQSFSATIKAPTVGTGQSRQISVSVNSSVTFTPEGETEPKTETGSANAGFTVKGAAAPTTVRQVSGRVKDDEGARVSGVSVVMVDSAGKRYETSTNGDGGYSFTSSDSQPIAAGNIKVAATKDGYNAASANVQGSAGRTVNVALTIKKVATASPSASPSASASASAEATTDATEEEEPGDEGTNEINAADPNAAANNTDDEGSNWLLIIMGVLLVAAGIGAMLLVWMRRKKAEELAETGIGKIPPATGGGNSFDQTRVAAPVGAGSRGNDATMIAPAGGVGGVGSLGDAPTMIHRQPVEDEFPDPYGAPLPANGGYAGQQTNQWGNEPADSNYGGGGNYGGTQAYGQQGGGYGAQQGGGQTQRYDEGTSMYQPEQPQVPQQQQRYDEATGMYQPEQGNGYDQGYGQQGGYDQGGWDNGQQPGGYDQGYGQQPGGWDQQQQQPQQPRQQGGWDDDQQGYGDQHGGGNYGQNRNWNG